MKVLILSHKPPYTYVDGGVLAIRNLMEAIAEMGHEVDMLSIETKKHPYIAPESSKNNIHIETVFNDTTVKAREAFLGLFRKGSYNVSRFKSGAFEERLRSKFSETDYDLIILESLFSTCYMSVLKELTKAPLILRSHNVEYKIWERLAEEESSFLKKSYLKHLCSRLKKYENEIMEKMDAILYISELDRKHFNFSDKHGVVIPFVRDLKKNESPVVNTSFFHLGSMDWKPNINGVDWLIHSVWPIVKKKVPAARLFLAGKDMPKDYFNLEEQGIFVEGYVDNGDSYMQEKGIMLVPLFSGGGIRIKIIDGLCNGVPILSTSVGAEGIPYRTDIDIAIADSPDAFAQKMIDFTESQEKVQSLSENGFLLAEQNYTISSIKPKLEQFFTALNLSQEQGSK